MRRRRGEEREENRRNLAKLKLTSPTTWTLIFQYFVVNTPTQRAAAVSGVVEVDVELVSDILAV